MLQEKILKGNSGLVFYSFTPPKITTEPERVLVIAEKQKQRLQGLEIDGIILYDIQDESTRTNEERTFSFMSTISPEIYSKKYLSDLELPKIIYKSIANHTRERFSQWLTENSDLDGVVFVGASSQQQIEATNFSLHDAYQLRKEAFRHMLLGGVTIPERHGKKGDEHLRIFSKHQQGCSFFVSQCVYNLHETKNLLSDYYYSALDNNRPFFPIVFTLAPCGSLKTLQFMQWLGIEVPKWLYNDLKYSDDILEASVKTCENIASEILEYAYSKNIPVGFNIESVSIKKEEIDAAGAMVKDVLRLLKREQKQEYLKSSELL